MDSPGWYSDPDNELLERWWDGRSWTTQARMKTAAQGAAEPPNSPEPATESANQNGSAVNLLNHDRRGASLSISEQELSGKIAELRSELIKTADQLLLQEVGLYEYSHPLDDSAAYKEALVALKAEFRECVMAGEALTSTERWTINGSDEEGAKMIRDLGKLLLRAYNTEVDNVIRTIRPYKKESSIARMEKMRSAISKLTGAMDLQITERYHNLRIKELELTSDYVEKRAEEKELAREERARLREEKAAQKELQLEHERLEKEQTHYRQAIEALLQRGDTDKAEAAQEKLAAIDSALEGIIQREANIRAGYVYVISNLGAFGDRVVKIGMTRRLEPMERVKELGGASVPFRFDVHVLVFSDDAVSLEKALHDTFSSHRMNLINTRREFFNVSPADVREALKGLKGDLLSFTDEAEAMEWRQSKNMRHLL